MLSRQTREIKHDNEDSGLIPIEMSDTMRQAIGCAQQEARTQLINNLRAETNFSNIEFFAEGGQAVTFRALNSEGK